MLYPTSKITDALAGIRQNLNGWLEKQSRDLANMPVDYKADYWSFWPENWSMEDIQAKCDMMSALPYTRPDGSQTNLLIWNFEEAYKRYLYIKNRLPNAFDDAKVDVTGAMTPQGVPYTQFLTPPRYYAWREDGGIVVGQKCVWDLPEEESQEE